MEKQEYILPVTYVKCAFCTAKNHCAACGGELTGDLRAKTGVEDAAVDLLTGDPDENEGQWRECPWPAARKIGFQP